MLSQRKRRGFVLLIVIVLLIVMATAMTSLATRSMQTSQEASVSIAQLQQRIGIESCRRTFLPRAEFVFKEIDGQRMDGKGSSSPDAGRMVGDMIELGEQRFDLILSDENAKVNLNSLYHSADEQQVMKVLRDSLPVPIAQSIALHPAVPSHSKSSGRQGSSTSNQAKSTEADPSGPDPGGTETNGMNDSLPPPAFRSWGEIFDFGILIGQSPDKQVQLDFTRSFTLWGSGQINILRADDKAITTMMNTVVTAAQSKKIMTKLREYNDVNIDIILEKELANPKTRKKMSNLIKTNSFAYSLFVDVDTSKCRSRKLFVNTLDDKGVQQILEFIFH